MTALRCIAVTFNTPIEPWEINAFRGAIVKKVGIEHEWFHNHRNDESGPGYHYRYPLIQYRYRRGFPSIVCLQHGIEEIQRLFSKPDWTIELKGRALPLGIKDINLKEVTVGLTPEMRSYRLQHWLPFNEQNYHTYQGLNYERDRLELLERILTGNILGMADGVGWEIEDALTVRIQRIVKTKFVSYKQSKMMAFNLDFDVNAILPYFSALGKGVSVGFGVIHRGH